MVGSLVSFIARRQHSHRRRRHRLHRSPRGAVLLQKLARCSRQPASQPTNKPVKMGASPRARLLLSVIRRKE
jgi:hypothetical protein